MLGPLRLFSTAGFRSHIGGEVHAETVRVLRPAYRSRANRFVVAAAEESLRQAGLSSQELAAAAVSIGGAGGGMLEVEDWYWQRYHQRHALRQRWALRTMLPAAQTDALIR
jgi:3-oxoacyl-(acyl-carrier-protein) synthase